MKKLLLTPILFFSMLISFGQTDTVLHSCDFSSGQQNMWGPSFNAFSINQTIDIFSFPWNTSGGTGNSGIVTILGQQFGAAANFSTSGVIGAQFSLNGFTTGQVQVDYPVDISLVKPIDSTFNQGETVTIKTSYTVADSFALDTWYPSLGTAKLDLYLQFAASADITLCAFGCVTIPIIPSFSTPTITLNIFNVSAAGVYYLGPACAEAIPYYSANAGPGGVGEPSPGQNVFPFALPPAEAGCTTIPWQVHESFLPLNLDDYCDQCGDFGIGGQLTIPYVETEDTLYTATNNLAAWGDSMYVELSLEIFKLIGSILAETNVPYLSQAGEVLANLSNDFELPAPFGTIYGATLSYNIMSASFVLDLTNKQRFDFKPKVYGKFEFPVPVQYWVKTPTGTTVSSGVSSIINCQIGNTIEYQFPCYFEELYIKPTYTVIGDFTNHTYDSIGFRFDFSALAFALNLPAFTIVPEIHVPSVCFPLPYPCPSWTNPFKWCTHTVCTPAFTIPAIGFDGFSFSLGPLVDVSLPIADATYDWFNDTWQLEGFQPCKHDSIRMKARLFFARETHTNVACKGNSTGSIDVTMYNGTTPFTYSWTNGAITQDLTSIPANGYFLTITDANGCQTATGATILEPTSVLTGSALSVDKLCFSGVNNGLIDLTTQGGTGPYSYLWSNTSTTEDISNLAAGNYSVVITDANGCTANYSTIINQPSDIVQSGNITNISCFGGSNGAVSVSVIGGTIPYSYSWSNSMNSDNIGNLIAGSYQLTVTDQNGCINVSNYVISQPTSYPSISFNSTQVSCYGGSNGSIDLTPSGGTPGYNYQWYDFANNLLPITNQDLSNVSDGTYTVQVSDANGCSVTGSVNISQPTNPIKDNASLTDVLCFGQSTGSIISGINGGTPGYTYSWSNGALTADLLNVVAGTYTLTVLDTKGCTDQYTYTLNQPSSGISMLLNPSSVKCFGEASGSINTNIVGGTTPYNYLWNTGNTTPSINSLIAGNYSLLVTDNNGCTLSMNTTVNQPLQPLTITNTQTNVNCFGGSNGSIDLTLTGGTSPYSYQWWDGTNQIMINTSQDLSNLHSSSYAVHVIDANNCFINDTITILEPSAPLAMSSIMNDVNCFGDNSGGLDVTITGGTLPYSYSWSNGQTSEDASNLVAGTYTLTLTDQNGCVLTNSYNVSQPNSAVNTVITNTSILCNSGSDGTATSFTTGGTAPYTYSWSNGSTNSSISNLTAGTYTLTTTDSKGCFSFAGTTIAQPSAALNAVVNITDASCYNYNDGKIQLTVSGGTQPYYFSWSNSAEIILNNPSETLNNLSANSYLVRIHDKNNCEWSQIIAVGQPNPFNAITTPTNTRCNNDSTGLILLSVSGGTIPYTYLWSNGQTSQNINNIPSGIYSVTVTDAQGCKVKDTTFVDQPLAIYIMAEISKISCIDQQDGAINVTVAGGTQPYSYSWNTGQTSQDIKELEEGTYILTVSDNNLCTAIKTIVVDPEFNNCVNPVNTFTPNGDDYNDTWIIENLDLYPNASIEVFNKWGTLVHSQKGIYVPWDGKFKGEILPSDVYYYIIDLYNNQENKYTGSITIIR